MSPGGSGSQEPFSSRNPSNLPRTSESQSNIGLSSPLVQSAETPNFSQSVIPGPESHWPLQHIQGSICTVQGGSQPTGFALPLPSHHSTLNPGTSQPHTLPGLNYPTESTAQSSIEDTIPIKEEIESEVPRHSNVPLHGYQQQEHQLPASYLTALGNPSRHSQPRSPPVARPFHPQSVSGTSQPEQPLMTSPPPYMINQPAYYFPDTQPIPSHPTPISSQPPSMTAPEPIYSSPESAAAKDSDPVRVLNLRPRPQCWDHGCNGREFSTFSNLLRHQREKSGVVAKAECPVCGAVFTRTTARNIHVAQGKCKSPGRESSAE
ncbi:hypothetical protein PENNAL_c0025G01261 [Penicillium nalgiovense]|uniref:C2H2-type domain-containing protein n=1 Tax=Penicillium nalgiovense TaxID=60175 RepID=A0A1V6YBT0_PENNA|nr:hypothetical protein PENNAL_c0025G01261 [Penicillium nalgiovense]